MAFAYTSLERAGQTMNNYHLYTLDTLIKKLKLADKEVERCMNKYPIDWMKLEKLSQKRSELRAAVIARREQLELGL